MERIVVSDLMKKYGNNNVLQGLSFTVQEGEIYALIGVNGAGKTTVFEIIEGLRTYDSGKIELNYSQSNLLASEMGIQLQITSFPINYKVYEMINIVENYKKANNSQDIVKRLNLGEILNKKMANLSLGQQRRVAIGLALINNPQILIFDEPTAGLDPIAKRDLHDILLKERNRGVSILISSHDMNEIERIADKIGILKDGEIIAEATAIELTAAKKDDVLIQIRTKKRAENFNNVKCKYSKKENSSYVQLATNDIDATLWTLLQELKETGDQIEDLKIERGSLEDYLVNLNNKNRR